MADPIRPTQDFGAFVDNHFKSKGAQAAPSDALGLGSTPATTNDFGSFLAKKFAPPAPTPKPSETQDTRPLSYQIVDPLNLGAEEFAKGLKSGAHASASAIGTLVGADEFAKRQGELAAANPASVGSFTQIRNPQDASQYLYGLLGQSAPEMAAVGATVAGAATVGAPAVIATATGAAVSSLFHAGRNLQRQEEETGEQSYGRAVAAAALQGTLDVAVPGKLSSVVMDRLAGAMEAAFMKSGLSREVAMDAAKETGTETLQQLIEIGQANPDLLRVMVAPNGQEESVRSDELLMELAESAVGGFAAGGTASFIVNAGRFQGPQAEQLADASAIVEMDDKDLGTADAPAVTDPSPELSTNTPDIALQDTATTPRPEGGTATPPAPVSEEKSQEIPQRANGFDQAEFNKLWAQIHSKGGTPIDLEDQFLTGIFGAMEALKEAGVLTQEEVDKVDNADWQQLMNASPVAKEAYDNYIIFPMAGEDKEGFFYAKYKVIDSFLKAIAIDEVVNPKQEAAAKDWVEVEGELVDLDTVDLDFEPLEEGQIDTPKVVETPTAMVAAPVEHFGPKFDPNLEQYIPAIKPVFSGSPLMYLETLPTPLKYLSFSDFKTSITDQEYQTLAKAAEKQDGKTLVAIADKIFDELEPYNKEKWLSLESSQIDWWKSNYKEHINDEFQSKITDIETDLESGLKFRFILKTIVENVKPPILKLRNILQTISMLAEQGQITEKTAIEFLIHQFGLEGANLPSPDKPVTKKVSLKKLATPKPYLPGIADNPEQWAQFNAHVMYSYDGKQQVQALLNSPMLKGIMLNPNYQVWAKDNKFWWDPATSKPYIGAWKPGLLPGILFHNSSKFDMDDYAEGRFTQLKKFSSAKAGSSTSGGDTKYGVFFNDFPDMKWNMHHQLPGGNFGYKVPLLTSIKKPMLVNSTNVSWGSGYTIPYLEKAISNDHDAVFFLGIQDTGGPQNQIVIPWDKANATRLKSPFNKGSFDPNVEHFSLNVGGWESSSQTLSAWDYQQLKDTLKKFGLGDVNLKVFAPGKHGSGIRAFFGRDMDGLLIGLTNAIENSWSDLHHEVVHALKFLGFFDSVEGKRMWKALANEVKIRGISKVVKENYAKENWVEETIARMLGEYVKTQDPNAVAEKKPLWQRGLDRIISAFTALVNWGAGYGFTNSSEIFEYLTSGSIGMQTWLENTREEPRDAALVIDRAIIAMNKVGVKVPKGLKQNADYYNGLVKWGWNIVQLAKKNLHIAWLQEYVQQANRWYNEKMVWLSRANETIGMWNNISSSQQDSLSKMIFEVEEMAYRTPQEIANGVVRKPTKAELAALVQKYQLTKETFDVYLKIRQDFDAILDKLETIALRDIIRIMPNNPIGQQIEGMKIAKEFAELRKRPYFPHARFGNYTIVVKNSKNKTIYMEAFESEKSRAKALESVKKGFPNDTVSLSFIPEEAQVFRGMPPSILMAIRHNLNLTKEQEAALEDLMVQWSPTQSFKNHFVRKEGTPGYSRDALRAYADYFWHGANHIARLEYGPLMQDAIKGGEKDISGMIASGEDSTARGKITDYLRHHFESIMNPKPDWAQLRTVGFLWWLGFNVKSALLNFTQVPMVGLPFLSAHFGDLRAGQELTRAMAHLRTIYRSPTKAQAQSGTADEKLIGLGIEQGFLEESFAQQLAGIAEGGPLMKTRSGTQVHKRLLQFNAAAGWMFQTMEHINRRVVFMAAVNLARSNPNAKYLTDLTKEYSLEYSDLLQKGLAPKEALAFLAGKDTVRSTQFEYSAWARPRFMEGRKSAFFTFFMFTQNMLWFIQNSPGNTRYLLLLLATAGIMGMPGAEDLEALIAWTARQMGYEWNLEKELREVLVEVVGEDGAPPDLFLRGLSRYGFGLEHLGDMTGIPLPGIDMSGNIGMGSPLPIVSPAIQALNRQGDFDDKLSQFTQEGVGATFGIGINILRSIADTDLALDDPKRWERAVPTAVANVSKAYRQWKDEAETMRGGAELIPFDRANPEHMAEIIAQGLGFRPTRTAQAWDKLIMQRETEMFWGYRRSALMAQHYQAIKGGDREERRASIEAIARFNKTVPYPMLRLDSATLARSRAQRDLSLAKKSAGLPNSNMMRGVYREVGRLHPETAVTESQEKMPSGK